jgi:hypothetical protein
MDTSMQILYRSSIVQLLPIDQPTNLQASGTSISIGVVVLWTAAFAWTASFLMPFLHGCFVYVLAYIPEYRNYDDVDARYLNIKRADSVLSSAIKHRDDFLLRRVEDKISNHRRAALDDRKNATASFHLLSQGFASYAIWKWAGMNSIVAIATTHIEALGVFRYLFAVLLLLFVLYLAIEAFMSPHDRGSIARIDLTDAELGVDVEKRN